MKFKRLLAMILSIAIIANTGILVFASETEEMSIINDSDESGTTIIEEFVEETENQETINEVLNESTDLINYPVSDLGDYISFDKLTGTITYCSENVVSCNIPEKINEIIVKKIGKNAFSECTSLTEIGIPESVTSISDSAFEGCIELKTIKYSGNCLQWKDVEQSINTTEIFIEMSHSEETIVIEGQAPTCTENGLTEGKCCAVCNEVLVKQQIIDALGHTDENKCSVCGEVLQEQEGEVIEEKEDIVEEIETIEETEEKEYKNPFKDVDGTRYFYEPVLWAVRNKITTGVKPDQFAPDEPCTRAQVVTFLWRAAGEPEASKDCAFIDMREGAYYIEAVNWAVEKGITTGTSPDKFSPDEVCTRAQIVTFLYRAAGSNKVNTSNSFEDVKAEAYYADAVNWAVAGKITKGTSERKFSPNEKCTRGQSVTFLYRYYVEPGYGFSPMSAIANAEFVLEGNNNFGVSYNVYAKANEVSVDNMYYLMLADSYSGKIFGDPLASSKITNKISVNIPVTERMRLKEIAMSKLVLAIRQGDGSYKAVNQAVSISNPKAIAKNTSAIFKASSKKGLQGVSYASNGSMPVDARYANTKQTLLNLDIADVVNPKSNYTNYTYKGKTYKFSKCSDLVANIQSMNAGYEQYLYGNNGNTKVAVSLCLLLSYDSTNDFLIDPAARAAGHRYYTLNVREEKARETLEALFVYLGEIFGQENCYVTNWILGNEINSSKAWNYSGSLSYDTYMSSYTTAFKMLYDAVKLEKTGNTVSISLDNGWTAAPDTYAGKSILDTFAKKIHAEDASIEWSISYHPYSYPLTRADFWNDFSNTTNSTSTKYISMNNITVLTNYAVSLEKIYKMDAGSIRVLLTEQGYSYSAGADIQATAIARGYYIAEFNDRIDAFIIRAIVDDAEEMKGNLYFGLMNSQQEKRTAFYIYEFMDSDLNKLKNTSASSVVSSVNYGKFNSAKNILCNTNWESIVPGFNATKLSGIK